MTVIEKAPAKINLGLNIINKRDDGYHELLSIFQTVSIYDTLEISLSGNPGMICEHPDVPVDSSNIILQAEHLLSKDFNDLPPVHYVLDKQIPVGAGLGGGSSDAAAALRGLNKIHNLKLSDKSLYDYACELGSDVPFMINGGTSVVSGRGEILLDVEWPFDFTYLVVYPNIAVSTAWAYKSLEELGGEYSEYKKITDDLSGGKLDEKEFLRLLSNDFENTVFEKYPLLGKIKSDIISYGAETSIMSGSGSSIVGIFTKVDKAYQCAGLFKDTDYNVFIANAVSKKQF
ncbi:4-(cytidine 5'-diphospho)-2-C-methyl-D-erythritol kinase [Candidatus Latescibacterota bacterium]